MKKVLLPTLSIVILLVGVYLVISLNRQSKPASSEAISSQSASFSSQQSSQNSSLTQQPETEIVETKALGQYTDYSSTKLSSDTNILFFAADWCPSCRALDKDITANKDKIPAGVNIFNVDYDQEQSLRIKYGVTIQHTLIQVDKNGNELNQWNGLYNLSTLQDILNLL